MKPTSTLPPHSDFISALRFIPAPLAMASALFLLALTGLAYMRFPALRTGSGAASAAVLLLGLMPAIAVVWLWVRRSMEWQTDEAEGMAALPGERSGMLLFIASELMFFTGFFWAYFHFATSPEISSLTAWPPAAMRPPDVWGGPLLNTVILLISGMAVAAAHDAYLRGRAEFAQLMLGSAIALGFAFLFLQMREFLFLPFGYRDGVYASVFYIATGFHGIHVLVGVFFLSVCFLLLRTAKFRKSSHFGFEAAVWYWHFVDAVWLLLFAVFYVWVG